MTGTPRQTAADLGVGIIGIGRHGSRYARHIVDDVPGLRLAGVSRRSSEGAQQAARWGTRFFPDWPQLVDDREVEAVIAATTPNLNLAIAEHCARVGKPLLLEKPLAVDGRTAQRIVAVMAAARVPLTVGQTLRYNATVLGLRRYLGEFGRLHSFHASQRLEKTLHGWLDDPELAGGGVILHTAVHVFDALRFITNREIERVRALACRRHNQCLEDLFFAQLELEGGLLGTVEASKVGPARSGRYEFVGNAGQLQGDQVHGILECIEQQTITRLPLSPPAPTIVPLLEDWRQFLAGGGENPIPGREGMRAVQVADACLQSARSGNWVAVLPMP